MRANAEPSLEAEFKRNWLRQQVGFPAAISEHFDVIDLHRPSDLHHDLVEK